MNARPNILATEVSKTFSSLTCMSNGVDRPQILEGKSSGRVTGRMALPGYSMLFELNFATSNQRNSN